MPSGSETGAGFLTPSLKYTKTRRHMVTNNAQMGGPTVFWGIAKEPAGCTAWVLKLPRALPLFSGERSFPVPWAGGAVAFRVIRGCWP